jgi:hypothetical protein
MAGAREYVMADARPRHDDFAYLRREESGLYLPVQPDEDGRYHSLVVPGFWIDPNWFRQDPLPDVVDVMYAIAGQVYDEWLAAKRQAWLADRAAE